MAEGNEPVEVNDIGIDLVEKAESEWAEVERLQNGKYYVPSIYKISVTMKINAK